MPPAADSTELTRRRWDEMAAGYDRWIAFFERILFAEGRRRVCSRALGDTLEIAVGTGRNLALYPGGVRLVGVDLSPEMLRRARERAAESGFTVDLREGDAERLAFEDALFRFDRHHPRALLDPRRRSRSARGLPGAQAWRPAAPARARWKSEPRRSRRPAGSSTRSRCRSRATTCCASRWCISWRPGSRSKNWSGSSSGSWSGSPPANRLPRRLLHPEPDQLRGPVRGHGHQRDHYKCPPHPLREADGQPPPG